MATSMKRGDLLLLIAVLAAFGVVDAAYLTWQWYAGASASWCDVNVIWNCSKVRESPWAHVGPVPTAVVGIAGFVIILLLAVLALRGMESLGPWSLDRWLLVFAIGGALIGFGLTLIEIFVIQAVCILCVFGFALDLGILGVAVVLPRAT